MPTIMSDLKEIVYEFEDRRRKLRGRKGEGRAVKGQKKETRKKAGDTGNPLQTPPGILTHLHPHVTRTQSRRHTGGVESLRRKLDG